MAGIFNSAIFNNAIFNVGGVAAPAVSPGAGSARRRRRERVVYRLFLKGKPFLFDDVESLVMFLEHQELEAEERVAKVAVRDAQRIEHVGRAARAPRPPLVHLRSEVPEIRDYITNLQAKIDALYWRKLESRLIEEVDTEEDIIILASILRI